MPGGHLADMLVLSLILCELFQLFEVIRIQVLHITPHKVAVMKRFALLATILSSLVATPALSGNVPFNGNWKEQRFSLFSKNKYGLNGDRLDVTSKGSVSMVYVPVSEGDWGAKSASWSWSVSQGVPATDLRNKGGDDRNLAVYAVFVPEADAKALKGASIRKLLEAESARVLVYVWGGSHGRGEVLDSPYLGSRGKTVVLRGSGEGSFNENVNLAQDYSRAFGGSAGSLVGLAISADSDDTDTVIQGAISGLNLK